MKIVFDSTEEKVRFINKMLAFRLCPSTLGLKEAGGRTCGLGLCMECWENALN